MEERIWAAERTNARLAVNKDGFVFVLDAGNSNVIMLDSNLEFVREIIPKTKINKPNRMYLDDVTGRLYVGDWKELPRIKSFDRVFGAEL